MTWLPTFIFGGIAVLFLAMWLVKRGLAGRTLREAEVAAARGDDETALRLWKESLDWSNESPETEATILERIESVYRRHAIPFSSADYLKLMDQYRALAKKSSNRALRELSQVQTLKSRVVAGWPPLPSSALQSEAG